MKLKTIGLDLAKNTFFLIGLDTHNKPAWRKKLSRSKLPTFMAQQEPSIVVMEACSSAHYWARRFKQLGHEVRLLPPQHVKAYLRGQKNDYNDALAIAEASVHSAIRPVPIKTLEQQDKQAFHRIRRELKSEQTRIVNQVRGLLAEYGITISKGIANVGKVIPEILEDGDNGLTVSFRQLLHRQYTRYQALCKEIDWYDQQLKREANTDPVVKNLVEAPGFGVVNASLIANWLGSGHQFKRGRDASAALGLVPRQHTTGGKDKLYGITKRGDAYVRTALVHGARAVVSRAKTKSDRLSQWINRLVATRGFNKAAIALANKMVRIAWAITTRNEVYRPATAAA